MECQKFGGTLVEPRSSVELRKLLSLARISGGSKRFWAGVFEITAGGGATIAVFKSDMTELPPNVLAHVSIAGASASERCIAFVPCRSELDGTLCRGVSGSYILDDRVCSEENYFICQIRAS